jgi:hypothetical protein
LERVGQNGFCEEELEGIDSSEFVTILNYPKCLLAAQWRELARMRTMELPSVRKYCSFPFPQLWHFERRMIELLLRLLGLH